MLKKFLLASLFFLPSLAFGQRFGSIKTSNDVTLTTGTVLNTSTAESKTFYVSSGTATSFGTRLIEFNYPASGAFTSNTYASIQESNSDFSPTSLFYQGGPRPIGFQNNYNSSNYTSMYLDGQSHHFTVYDVTSAGSQTVLFRASTSLGLGTNLPLVLYTSTYGGTTYTSLNSTNTVGHLDLYLPPADGTSGQALVTDGAGRLTFATVTGAGSGPFTNATATTTISMAGKDINSVGNLVSSGTISTSLDIVASGIIGSNTGNFNVAGTTITATAPAIDTSDRIPILNNGALTWPLAVTDGARLGSNQTFTGANVFNTTSTIVINGTTTVMGIVKDNTGSAGTATYVLTSNGATGPPTWQAGAASGSSPFSSAIATTSINMATFTITGVPSIGWADSGGGWISRPSTHSVVTAAFTVANSSWSIPNLQFAMVANSTYSFTAHVIWSVSGSAPSGARFGFSVPAGVGTVIWSQGGAGASATAANFSQKGTAPTDFTATAAGAAASQTWSVDITGVVMTGTSGAGSAVVQMAPASAGTTYTLQPGSQITAWKDQ